MTKLAQGPTMTLRPGHEIELSKEMAAALIKVGAAVPVVVDRAGAEKAVLAPVEDMILSPQQREYAAALDVTAVGGIGEARAEALAEKLQVRTVGDLAEAEAGMVVAVLQGVSLARARRWIKAAKELMR